MWGNLPPDLGAIRPLASVYGRVIVSTDLKEKATGQPGGLLLLLGRHRAALNVGVRLWIVDLKHTLTFFGLLSDLLGAALLSIPMIWDTRSAAHTILRTMKRVKFWLYGYANPRSSIQGEILSRDVREVHERIIQIQLFFLVIFAIVGLRLIQIFVSKTPISSLPFGGNPFWVWTAMGVVALATGLALWFLGRLPLYLARGLIWTARGNHERRIGFCGLGILCIGFILQAAVNLM
jgi:hypothetical protein